MILAVQVTGVFTTNAYFFIDDETGHGFLLDPGAEAGKLLSIISDRGLTVEQILLTHGHFDHLGAAAELQQKLSIPIYMHENGRDYAPNPRWNLSESCNCPMVLTDVEYLSDGSRIALREKPDFYLTMQHTSGHTTDSVIYWSKDNQLAFVGDSIFKGSFGLTHFYGGDEATLMQSVTRVILTLPEDTVLLSGHSEPTTVRAERGRSWYAPYL